MFKIVIFLCAKNTQLKILTTTPPRQNIARFTNLPFAPSTLIYKLKKREATTAVGYGPWLNPHFQPNNRPAEALLFLKHRYQGAETSLLNAAPRRGTREPAHAGGPVLQPFTLPFPGYVVWEPDAYIL